jgi:fructuronate reductase
VRLSDDTCPRLPDAVARPTYDRASQKCGIVHFGIGAFHRAHQAVYTDDAMSAGERDWGIVGVSLRSAGVADQMNPQDGLYSVTERSTSGTPTRLISAVREVLVASRSPALVATNLSAPETKIVSFTVTEKGYCRASDGNLDLELAEDASFYPLLAKAFKERRGAGIEGLTLLSCDNLSGNGVLLERLIIEYLEHNAPDLTEWFTANCTCPSTMVDRIVPATTEADLAEIEGRLGMRDEAAVVTEPFSQWVIEDKFAGPRPLWERHGADLVADVAPYETAKLRVLNGAHSALAYIGLGTGHEFVHQAIADPKIRPIVERLMHQEAAPSISAPSGQDLGVYADALLSRFANHALNHRLIQIAMDGSQKIPQRWLETLAWNRLAGRECPSILAGLTAWFAHLKGQNGPVDDPRAAELAQLSLGNDPFENIGAIFGQTRASTPPLG